MTILEESKHPNATSSDVKKSQHYCFTSTQHRANINAALLFYIRSKFVQHPNATSMQHQAACLILSSLIVLLELSGASLSGRPGAIPRPNDMADRTLTSLQLHLQIALFFRSCFLTILGRSWLRFPSQLPPKIDQNPRKIDAKMPSILDSVF